MISLIDLDMNAQKTRNRLIPNLEVMKLAAYYQSEENETCHLVLPNEQPQFDDTDKVFCISEADVPPDIPGYIRSAPNVEYVGSGFTKREYVPFENTLIDFTLPRIDIYKRLLQYKYDSGVKERVIEHALDDTYYRAYAGNERLPIPAANSLKRFFLFDRTFFYPDWQDIMTEISDRHPSTIITLHPIRVTDFEDYLKLRKFKKLSAESDIYFDITFPVNGMQHMIKHYKGILLQDINIQSHMYIPFGGSLNTDMEYYKDLIYKLNVLYTCWSNGILVKMAYEPPLPGYKNPIEHLAHAIVLWANVKSAKNRGKTLNQRITLKTKVSRAIEERDKFLSYYPKQVDLFNQYYNHLVRKKDWRA